MWNYSLISLVLLTLVGAIQLKVPSEEAVRHVSSFIEFLSDEFSHREPSFVIVHDFENGIPHVLRKTFRHLSFQTPGLVISDVNGYVPDNVTLTDINWWYWLLATPKTLIDQNKCIFFVLIFHSETFDKVLRKAAATVLLQNDRHFLILWNQDGEYEDILEHHDLRFMKNKIMMLTDENTGVSRLKSVCFFCDYGSPEIVNIGNFSLETGLSLNYPILFPDFTRDLHGAFLTATWISYNLPENVLYTRKNYLMMPPPESHLLDAGHFMNFHWMITEYDPPAPGTPIEILLADGTYRGMAGAVIHGHADISCPRIIPTHLLPVHNFIHVPLVHEVFSFTSRVPRPDSPYLAVVKPYTSGMWLALFIACFISSFIFTLNLYLNFKYIQNPFPKNQRPKNLLIYSMRYLFSTLMEENPPLVPNAVNPRTFIVFWWLFSIVVICGYESKLISFLAHPPPESVPLTYYDLAERKSWRVGMPTAHSPYYAVITGGPNAIERFRIVGEKLEHGGTVYECIEKTWKEDYSCTTLNNYLVMIRQLLIDKEGFIPVDLRLGDTLATPMTFAVPKYSELVPIFTEHSFRMSESGLAHKIEKDFEYSGMIEGLKVARKQDRWHKRTMALKVEQMSGAFFGLIIFGFVMPIFLFIWEIKEKISKFVTCVKYCNGN